MIQDPKQVIIVRQSSLKVVTDYLRMIGSPMKFKEVVGMADVLTEYVMNGRTKEVMSKLDKIDSFIENRFMEE